MTLFRFSARTSDQSRKTGTIEADDRSQALDLLMSRQLTPLSLKPVRTHQQPRLSYKDAGRLAAEISRMVGAGVPLESGIALAADGQESQAARSALTLAAERISRGQGPREAFSGLAGIPGTAFSKVVAAGERTGQIASALGAAAPLFTATARFREKLVSLLLYPAVVAAMALCAIIVFLMVVIPSLRPILEDLGDRDVGAAGRLLAIADFTPTVLISALIIVLVTILLAQVPKIRTSMRHWRDAAALSPFGLGLADCVDMALFARLFAALVEAGAPVGDAMEDAASALSNSILRDRLKSAAANVREGHRLDQAVAEVLGERHLVVQAVRLGARGGSFHALLAEAGATLEARAEVRLERLAKLAEPAIMIVIGGFVGVLVLTLYSALTALPDLATS